MKGKLKLGSLILAMLMVMNIAGAVFAVEAGTDEIIHAKLLKEIKDLDKVIEDFTKPANSVLGLATGITDKINKAVEADVLEEATDAAALKAALASKVALATSRMKFEGYKSYPATLEVGDALVAFRDVDFAGLPTVSDKIDEYIVGTFAIKHVNHLIDEYLMYNPGKSVIAQIDEALANIQTWVGVLEYQTIKEQVDVIRKKAVEDFINPPTGEPGTPSVPDKPVNPDKPDEPSKPDEPNKPVDPNKPVNPDKPAEPEYPSDSEEILDEDLAVFYKFADNIALELSGIPTIELPALPSAYSALVEVRDVATNKVLGTLTVKTEAGEIKIPGLTSDVEVVVGFQMHRAVKGKDSVYIGQDRRNFSITDDAAPVLNYAYVIDGGLILNISDNSGLDKNNPIVYRSLGEDTFKAIGINNGYGQNFGSSSGFDDINEDLFNKAAFDRYKRLHINDYRIEVDIPDTLQIVATDSFGNKAPFTVEIIANNVKLTKNTPDYVDKLIESVTVSKFKSNKVNDLMSVTKGVTVDVFEQFKQQILKEFKRFNSHDLVYSTSAGTILSGSSHKFDTVGLHEISVTHRSQAGEFIAYINVNESAGNVQSYTVKTDVDVKESKFKISAAIDAKLAANATLNASQFIALVDGEYVRLDKEIEFGNKKEIKATIIDLNTGKEYSITFKKGASVVDNNDLFPGTGTENRPNNPVYLTDISNHWSRPHVQKLVDRGVITGYSDGTFGPNNMITVRETLAIVGRVVLQNPNYSNPAKNGMEVTGWGKTEIDAALQTLSRDVFNGNYERAITRGEVAYVMNEALRISGNSNFVYLSDIEGSAYANAINNLVGSGVIAGMPDGTFRPNLEITRGELATMISRTPMY